MCGVSDVTTKSLSSVHAFFYHSQGSISCLSTQHYEIRDEQGEVVPSWQKELKIAGSLLFQWQAF